MIEIKQVSQAYGTQDILKNVSIKIKEKRITALVGAKRCKAKTTLLNVAAKPDTGKMRSGFPGRKGYP